MSTATISCTGVSKRYAEKVAVEDVSLVVEPGQCIALVGHNGAGKTTLMKMLLGLTGPSDGSIRVMDSDPVNMAASVRRSIGFLPETVSFDNAMTGREVMAFFTKLKGVPVQEGIQLLEKVGLADAMKNRVKTYSKGMRQRLGLAQVLLGSPKLLLLDEPTTGLDPDSRRTFYDIIRDRCQAGAAAILSSHILTELEARTDRVAIMNKGRLVAYDTLDALRGEAGLSVHIRLTVKDGGTADVAERLRDAAPLTRVNGTQIDLACGTGDKMQILHSIAMLGERVGDVEILPPTFDEVYNHFCHQGDRS